MADSSVPPVTTSPGTRSTGRESSRSLDEPVLSSAQEELDVDTPAHDTGTSYTGMDDSSMAYGASSSASAWWSRTQDQIGRYVSEQPGKAALLALGVGALATLLLGQRVRSRRRRD